MIIRCKIASILVNGKSLSRRVRNHAPLKRMTTRHAYFTNGLKVRGYAPYAFSLVNQSITQQCIPALFIKPEVTP